MSSRPPTDDVLARFADRLLDSKLLSPEDLRDDGVPRRIGRYAVEHPLGRGAHGRVFAARGTGSDLVALKLLTGPEPRETRLASVRRAAAVSHPGLLRILEVVDAPEGLCVVTEHVDQPSLSECTLSLESALWVLEQVARAVAAAHGAGLVHGNLHGGNVLVGERVLVTDLGVAASPGAHAVDDVAALCALVDDALAGAVEGEPGAGWRRPEGIASAGELAEVLRRRREGSPWRQPGAWLLAAVLICLGLALGAVLALGAR